MTFSINLSSLNGSNGFRLDGVAAGDDSGRSVSNAGDVNGDGFDDLIVGADKADPNGNCIRFQLRGVWSSIRFQCCDEFIQSQWQQWFSTGWRDGE